jgi:hypothetical protein
LDFELVVRAATELAARGAHLGSVVGLFALAKVFAQGSVSTVSGDCPRQAMASSPFF